MVTTSYNTPPRSPRPHGPSRGNKQTDSQSELALHILPIFHLGFFELTFCPPCMALPIILSLYVYLNRRMGIFNLEPSGVLSMGHLPRRQIWLSHKNKDPLKGLYVVARNFLPALIGLILAKHASYLVRGRSNKH